MNGLTEDENNRDDISAGGEIGPRSPSQCCKNDTRKRLGTYVDHRMAELASAFLVISQASSSTTGSMVREHMPMMAITTKIAARLLGLTVKRASTVHEGDTKYGTEMVGEKPSAKGRPTRGPDSLTNPDEHKPADPHQWGTNSGEY